MRNIGILVISLFFLVACQQAARPQSQPAASKAVGAELLQPQAIGMTPAISAGSGYTCALTAEGKIKCWGYNNYGQLGNGQIGDGTFPSAPVISPVEVLASPGVLLTGIQSIAAGVEHTCALTAAGEVKCWGRAHLGQLGDGTNNSPYKTFPVTVLASFGVVLNDIRAISVGLSHTCALTNAGGVKCWGYNNNGQLGDGTSGINRLYPVTIHASAGLPLTGIQAIAAGDSHTCALTSTGEVLCWGDNSYGELGVGIQTQSLYPVKVLLPNQSPLSGIQAISVGNFHSCAVTSSGGVKCWGDDLYAQVGGSTTGLPVRFAKDVVVDSSNTPISGIQSVDAGHTHTCALTNSSGVQCWGNNEVSQLGIGVSGGKYSYPQSVVGISGVALAVSAGDQHTCTIVNNGKARCWGYAYANGASAHQSTPIEIPNLYLLDITPPTTTVILGPSSPNGSNGWYKTSVTFNISATDDANPGASGVKETRCQLDGSVPATFDVLQTCPTGVATDGVHTLYYASRDNAGITENIKSIGIQIDQAPPSGMLGIPDRGFDSNNWYNHPVVYTITGSDATSGIASCPAVTYSSPNTANAGSATVLGACTDNAGNQRTGYPIASINYDSKPPTLSPVVSPTTVVVGGNVIVIANAQDEHSQIASSSCTSPDTSSLGSKTVTCTAVDNAGNSATAIASYQVTSPSDTIPPDTQLLSKPNSPINSTAATFTFTGTDNEAGSLSFRCKLDGDSVQNCVSPKTYFNPPLSQGSHIFQVWAMDAAGNEDPTPASYTWLIDTTTPTVTVTGVVNGVTYKLSHGPVPTAGCNTVDSLSGVATHATVAVTIKVKKTTQLASNPPTSPGTYTATCSGGKDKVGNLAQPIGVTFAVVKR